MIIISIIACARIQLYMLHKIYSDANHMPSSNTSYWNLFYTFLCPRLYHIVKNIAIIFYNEYSITLILMTWDKAQSHLHFRFWTLARVSWRKRDEIILKISCIFCVTGIRISHFCDSKGFLLLLQDPASFPGKNLLSVRCAPKLSQTL